MKRETAKVKRRDSPILSHSQRVINLRKLVSQELL
jgi:hypothetical protein